MRDCECDNEGNRNGDQKALVSFIDHRTTIDAIAGPTGFVRSESVYPCCPERRHHFQCLEGLGTLTWMIDRCIKAVRLGRHALLSRMSLADVSQREEECCERIEGQILLVRLCRNHMVRR
jgi:hypothetical protein